MGIIIKGILGGFRKKTGTVIGAFHRRKDVIRSLPRPNFKKATQKQIAQRQAFGLVTAYLSDFSLFIDVGFKVANSDTSPMNDAVAYHLAEAVTGEVPNLEMDHTKLMFSRGKREVPNLVEVKLGAGNAIEFTWDHRVLEDKRNNLLDKVTIVVYNPEKMIVMGVADVAVRSANKAKLVMPAFFKGNDLYCYISFSSHNNPLLCSNSRFIGKLMLV